MLDVQILSLEARSAWVYLTAPCLSELKQQGVEKRNSWNGHPVPFLTDLKLSRIQNMLMSMYRIPVLGSTPPSLSLWIAPIHPSNFSLEFTSSRSFTSSGRPSLTPCSKLGSLVMLSLNTVHLFNTWFPY